MMDEESNSIDSEEENKCESDINKNDSLKFRATNPAENFIAQIGPISASNGPKENLVDEDSSETETPKKRSKIAENETLENGNDSKAASLNGSSISSTLKLEDAPDSKKVDLNVEMNQSNSKSTGSSRSFSKKKPASSPRVAKSKQSEESQCAVRKSSRKTVAKTNGVSNGIESTSSINSKMNGSIESFVNDTFIDSKSSEVIKSLITTLEDSESKFWNQEDVPTLPNSVDFKNTYLKLAQQQLKASLISVELLKQIKGQQAEIVKLGKSVLSIMQKKEPRHLKPLVPAGKVLQDPMWQDKKFHNEPKVLFRALIIALASQSIFGDDILIKSNVERNEKFRHRLDPEKLAEIRRFSGEFLVKNGEKLNIDSASLDLESLWSDAKIRLQTHIKVLRMGRVMMKTDSKLPKHE